MTIQQNLFSFAFIDPTMLLSTLTLKYHRHFEDDQPRSVFPFQDCRTMVLRGPRDGDWSSDGEQVDGPLMTQWPTARDLIGQVQRKISEHLAAENFQIGCAYLEALKPGGAIGWHVDESPYAKAHQRFKLLISPCSGGVWFSGAECIAPGVGNLTYVNNCVLNSAINLGPAPQISLVVDLRRPTLQ